MVIQEFLGKIIEKIEKDYSEITFYLSNGAVYKQYHRQDCCEDVYIEDIEGDLNDLLFSKILQAEESTSDASTKDSESATWTFYKFATIKGYVTIRWFGTSNGYYSETAQIEKIKCEDPIKIQRRKKLLKLKN